MKFKPDNINPQGRPKVYFCCHPDDHEKYFDVVTNEILSKQNCTIWYTEGEFEKTEAFLAELKQMQLFVMPVTSSLLCSDNDTLKVEFRFAIENHIPVLPLLQESGLEQLFNKKCGDLQFLDKTNLDCTTISYEEKLEKYLSSVLIGDELAEKIRSAFDAYVFLSYRKKDRKHAQELMKLIHRNDFCRDIAIWYDEFLIPGENFNNAIREAIKKSDLFVLAVTPNIIAEDNYVMTEEYPTAKKEGKYIFPAEIVPTNIQLLCEKFEGIPLPTRTNNENKFSEMLLDSIRKIAIKEKETSPEHNFFIGLAYLNGIDVEVDFERAISLIISAAEANLLEAIRKLVTLYKDGIGVSRNYQKAACWQHRLIFLLEKRKDIALLELLNEYWLLGTLYNKSRQILKSKNTYDRMLRLCDKSTHIYKDNQVFAYLYCLACNNLGSIAYLEKNKDKARKYYDKVIELCEHHFHCSLELTQQMTVALTNKGIFLEDDGKYNEALECYYYVLSKRKKLINEENYSSFTDLANCYHNIILCYKKMGEPEHVRNNYFNLIELRKRIVNKAQNKYLKFDAVMSLVDDYFYFSYYEVETVKNKKGIRFLLEAISILNAHRNSLPQELSDAMDEKASKLFAQKREWMSF